LFRTKIPCDARLECCNILYLKVPPLFFQKSPYFVQKNPPVEVSDYGLAVILEYRIYHFYDGINIKVNIAIAIF